MSSQELHPSHDEEPWAEGGVGSGHERAAAQCPNAAHTFHLSRRKEVLKEEAAGCWNDKGVCTTVLRITLLSFGGQTAAVA